MLCEEGIYEQNGSVMFVYLFVCFLFSRRILNKQRLKNGKVGLNVV